MEYPHPAPGSCPEHKKSTKNFLTITKTSKSPSQPMNRPCLRLLHPRTQFRCNSTTVNSTSPSILKRPAFNLQQILEKQDLMKQNLEARNLGHLVPSIPK